MPWLSILMALISFFTTKKKTNGNTTAALAAGAITGLGTYYVTHETEWGKENLGFLDGVVTPPPATGNTTTGSNGVTLPKPEIKPGTGGFWDSTADVLKDWGPTGTAAVIGTAGLVATSSKDWLKWVGLGLVVYVLVK